MLLSGTEAGRLLTSVRALGAGIGAVLILAYLVKAPRHHDLVDGLVLAGLLAFLVTCITSSIPRLSFEAATSAIAYAAAFYVARGAVSDQRGRDLAVLLLGILGTILSLLFLIAWASVWIRWTSIVGGGLPPLDLTLPSAPFAPIRVAILIGLLTPATILLARRPRIWPAGVIGTAASFAVILMSGSRSVWLGVIAAAAVAVALGGGRRILRMPRPVLVGAAAVGVGFIAVVGPQLVARLATGSTIELRVGMWSETIARWLESPLLGYGPGTFPAQFNLTDYYNTYEPWTSHPHNAVVQLLLEGGIVGVIGLGFVAAAVVAGVRRAGHLAWAPAAAIGFLAAVSLTENPTLIPYLIVLLIVWVALAVPRVPAEQPSSADGRLRAAAVTLSAVVAGMVLAHLVASGAYEGASAAAETGNRDEVVRQLTVAATLDAAFPFYQRELGTWLLAQGDVD
ncbi:MAG TPA: O-antigen ligase family protein, partial [Candidatus Limnocylindrales bacterium]|nr:O-antigen ligase family protein [Candidatus Limnocylindrales bacterium]